jgi:hypothetical protein
VVATTANSELKKDENNVKNILEGAGGEKSSEHFGNVGDVAAGKAIRWRLFYEAMSDEIHLDISGHHFKSGKLYFVLYVVLYSSYRYHAGSFKGIIGNSAQICTQ